MTAGCFRRAAARCPSCGASSPASMLTYRPCVRPSVRAGATGADRRSRQPAQILEATDVWPSQARSAAYSRATPKLTAVTSNAQDPTQLYCARCLFLNPLDVAAPRWKRVWLDPEATACEVHGAPLASIASSSLRRCKNFDQILKVIGRTEFQRGKTLPGLRDMRYHRY